MKVNGQKLDNTKAIYGPEVIRRGKTLIGFYAQPVWSYDSFYELCPKPEPPPSAFSREGKKHDFKNPIYLENLERHGRQLWGYYILTSLEPSKLDLSEHGVNIDDPETWDKVEEALVHSKTNPDGLSHYEFKKVMNLVEEANMLDAEKLETNLESFLLGAARQEEPGDNFPIGEPESSLSGELVKDGA